MKDTDTTTTKIQLKDKFYIPIDEIEEFELKEGNLKKINLNHDEGLNGEGIWAWLSDADVKKYNEDNKGDYGVAVAANQSLIGIPWGAFFPFQFMGSTRPVCNIDKLINRELEVMFNSECKKNMDESEAKEDAS